MVHVNTNFRGKRVWDTKQRQIHLSRSKQDQEVFKNSWLSLEISLGLRKFLSQLSDRLLGFSFFNLHRTYSECLKLVKVRVLNVRGKSRLGEPHSETHQRLFWTRLGSKQTLWSDRTFKGANLFLWRLEFPRFPTLGLDGLSGCFELFFKIACWLLGEFSTPEVLGFSKPILDKRFSFWARQFLDRLLFE